MRMAITFDHVIEFLISIRKTGSFSEHLAFFSCSCRSLFGTITARQEGQQQRKSRGEIYKHRLVVPFAEIRWFVVTQKKGKGSPKNSEIYR